MIPHRFGTGGVARPTIEEATLYAVLLLLVSLMLSLAFAGKAEAYAPGKPAQDRSLDPQRPNPGDHQRVRKRLHLLASQPAHLRHARRSAALPCLSGAA